MGDLPRTTWLENKPRLSDLKAPTFQHPRAAHRPPPRTPHLPEPRLGRAGPAHREQVQEVLVGAAGRALSLEGGQLLQPQVEAVELVQVQTAIR